MEVVETSTLLPQKDGADSGDSDSVTSRLSTKTKQVQIKFA